MLDDPGLVVLAFVDTHNHLMLAARNILGVPVSQACDIAQIIALIRARAAQTPPGLWVITAADWHELQLAERRLPTAAELDQATAEHPVLLQRGGHNAVLNSAGLRAAGLGPGTPDIPGGFIARDEACQPSGWVQDAALEVARRALPPLPGPALAAGLAQASAQYAAHGLGTVRDPAVSPEEWHSYLAVHAAGQLAVRSHAMIFTTPAAAEAAAGSAPTPMPLEPRGSSEAPGTGGCGSWGLNRPGRRAAGGRPERDYADRAGRPRRADVEPGRPGGAWPPAPGAAGRSAPTPWATGPSRCCLTPFATWAGRPSGRARAPGARARRPDREPHRRRSSPGCVRHCPEALLDWLGPAFPAAWGAGRTAAPFPWRELVDAGTGISAGTDHPIGPLDPLRAIHGMTTRTTRPGVLGPEHAISRAEAIRL